MWIPLHIRYVQYGVVYLLNGYGVEVVSGSTFYPFEYFKISYQNKTKM